MHILLERDLLYQNVQKIINIIGNRPRLPVLTHILLHVNKNYLLMTATNLELEISTHILLTTEYPSTSITIPGRKFFDICRNLPKHSKISMTLKDNKIFINSDNSNFSLSTIPASNFPKTKIWQGEPHIIILKSILKSMIELTQFSMAHQDARYYLNGAFFETKNNTIRMVASDGYRLAMTEVTVDFVLPSKSVIIPRKGITEFLNLLNTDHNTVNIQIYDNCFYIKIGNYTCNSKLIDSIFPNYLNAFPEKPKNIFKIDRILLKQALKRVSVLSNIKLRIVNWYLTENQLKITSSNFDQETAEEILHISYANADIQISFNVDYLLDVINVINTQTIKLFLTDNKSSLQIEGLPKCCGATYIVMPIKI